MRGAYVCYERGLYGKILTILSRAEEETGLRAISGQPLCVLLHLRHPPGLPFRLKGSRALPCAAFHLLLPQFEPDERRYGAACSHGISLKRRRSHSYAGRAARMRCLFTERRVKFGAHAVNHAGALLSLPVVRLCTVSAFVISLCCCLRDGPR